MSRIENNISKMENSSVSVIGLGRSGVAAAQLANYLGATVFVSDNSSSDSVKKNIQLLNSIGVDGEIGGNSDKIFDADLMVISPGIPADSPIISEALKRNVKVIGEIEFASLFTDRKIIGVTGSNGKSTTVYALAEMCQSKEIIGILAGNVGIPFSDKVLNELRNPVCPEESGNPKQVYILEISSFQMEFIDQFHPYISIFLNISPDHLDRHKTFDNYIAAKFRLAENQTKQDYIIYNVDDKVLSESFQDIKIQQITFGPNNSSKNIFSIKNLNVINKEYAKLTKLENIGLPGQHNLYNLLAAASGAHCLGISDAKIANVMNTFKGIPHRLEYIAKIDGIEFINDSKATNIDAVKVAIESYEKPIILILGGLAKGNDFAELIKFRDKIKYIIAYGDANKVIHDELNSTFDVNLVDLLHDAVKLGYQKADKNEIVLLSPGCASFDQFKNFEDRGIKFSEWVRELAS